MSDVAPSDGPDRSDGSDLSDRQEKAQPKPVRTWRPMAMWSAVLLLVLGLTWFVGAVVVPYCQVLRCTFGNGYRGTDMVARLGGPDNALRKLRLYVCLPGAIVPHREWAVEAMGFCGSGALQDIIRALRDPDCWVRASAVYALTNIGAEAPVVVSALAAALEDEDQPVRSEAAQGLGRMGPSAAGAVRELLKAVDDTRVNDDVHMFAIVALDRVGQAGVPGLIDALRDERQRVRGHAAEFLGRLGPKAIEAAPAITDALQDRDPWVRSLAAEALKTIRGEEPPK